MTLMQMCPVPYNQRPSNEYNNIKNSFKFSWTFQSLTDFCISLTKIIVINYTISYVILVNIPNHATLIISRLIAELFLITSLLSIMYLLQSYLAYMYIYDRLMKSVITYEESGWYDGQIWIKSKEILVQDRLIGTYELQPKITRLKTVLYSFVIILGVSTITCIVN